jgi:hypothetical protein
MIKSILAASLLSLAGLSIASAAPVVPSTQLPSLANPPVVQIQDRRDRRMDRDHRMDRDRRDRRAPPRWVPPALGAWTSL